MKLLGSICLLYVAAEEDVSDENAITPIVNACNLESGELGFDVTIKNLASVPQLFNSYADSFEETDDGLNVILKFEALSDLDEFEITFDEDAQTMQAVLTIGDPDAEPVDPENCQNKQTVQGIDICMDTVSVSYSFTCNYSLADQEVDQEVHVQANQVVDSSESTGEGALQYDLLVGTGDDLSATQFDTVMGEVVNFKISPKTAGIVFATVKSCTISFDTDSGTESINIIGHNAKDMCYLDAVGAMWTDPTAVSSKGDISGQWKAFQWVSNGLSTIENQKLSCTIGLSQNQNTATAEECDI